MIIVPEIPPRISLIEDILNAGFHEGILESQNNFVEFNKKSSEESFS